MTIQELFEKSIENKASELHLISGSSPIIRIDGRLSPLATFPILTNLDIENLVKPIMSAAQQQLFSANRSIDFSYAYGGGDYGEKGRFRINLYYQRNTVAGAFRLLPPAIRTIEELLLPRICHKFSGLKQGFILVTGPTGHGKSTTIASIVNEINMNQAANIITIEDPIEYIYGKGKSIISQREIGSDTHSWDESLRSALRQDPDVVVIGEMRDFESVSSAITIAETGHLVFSTLHTNSAAQSVDRIIDAFPEHQQNQVRTQLSETLEGIISQRLIPRLDGGRVVATEILLGTNAVKSNIRDGKTHMLDSIIENSQDAGMIPLEVSLANLVKQGQVALEVAQQYALRQDSFIRLIG
ncbi:MAG: type IV pili twitching motility protein PilT [Candidatus Levybacteria bacterium CG_4_10_14_0_2_um_filter_36_16]|nr:MAG: type IV pili twitching motility protein PilT [Candidatus Levybacteria bacterium CG2_30_37_29]PIZ96478.1 MAG: type IV pili twitching motility protein PilT [Candidatus Levybacteria bacterium CG_4_10_14_0_2_um_filter_36_16]